MSTGETKPHFGRVALIGVGHLGSSLARAILKHGLADEIVACARTEATRTKILELGLVQAAYDKPEQAAEGADLVVIASPVGAFESIGRAIAAHLKAGAIVTDVGSVKQAVIRDLVPHIPDGVHFVPGHPIAGTEKSGPESGFAELFEDRWCILTPPPGTSEEAVEKVASLWRACGSTIEIMDPASHDKVLAITSHLPHLIAYTIVGTASDLKESMLDEIAKFSAGGFRDFTRIAASNPIMWRDIFLNNRDAVLEVLQRFTEDLTALQRAIRWGEGDILEDRFTRTRALRRGVVEAHQAGTFDPREPEEPSTAAPDRDKADPPEA